MNKVLITGSNSGLGKHLASKFIDRNYKVFEHKGSNHYDLSDLNELKKFADEAKDFGVNILINNAAIVCPNKEFILYSESEIKKMIEVNLMAPILLTYYLSNSLTNIININSMVGLEIKKRRTLYSATKWGLRGFSNSLKMEMKEITILDVFPTNIKTTPDRKNAMEVEDVVEKIYQAFNGKKQELILDGRPK